MLVFWLTKPKPFLFAFFKPLNTSLEHFKWRDLRETAQKEGRWICKNSEKNLRRKGRENTIRSTVVSEKRDGGQIANESGFGSTEWRKLKKEKESERKEGEERETVRQRESQRERAEWFGLEAGAASQGWQGFGGGVWWFRSPPARGASVSGGGPDHELPHPPRATATNPLSPFTTSTATHPTQNPLAGSASLKLLLLLHVYLIFWRNWNIFVG